MIKKKENNDISPYNVSYYSKIHSKPFSPNNELDDRKYIIECINKNDINYATAGYYLLNKFCC